LPLTNIQTGSESGSQRKLSEAHTMMRLKRSLIQQYSIARRQSQNVVKDIVQDFEDYYQQNELSKREETQDILVLTCDGKGIVMRPDGLRECTRKDSLMTISQTAKKLGVNTYEYILDRVSCEFKLPSLAELIQKKAKRIARQVLSLHNEK
jgi:hypothetical protein